MRRIFAFLFLVFISTYLKAQIDYKTSWPSKFRIGVEGGVGRNTLFGNPKLEKMDVASLGYSSGITFEYDLNQILHPDSTAKNTIHVSIKTGVYYDRKGGSSTPQSLFAAGFPPGNTTIRSHFEYATIPVIFKFMMGRSNRVKLYQIIGPYVSVLANQNTVYQRPDTSSLSYDYTSHYQKVDIGLIVGFGVEIPIQQQFYFSCELRENLGLFDISTPSSGTYGYTQTNATNLLFSFAYRFKRNKPYKEKVEE